MSMGIQWPREAGSQLADEWLCPQLMLGFPGAKVPAGFAC